jgi:cytochrome P450 family 110
MLPPGPRTPAFWQTYRFVMHPRETTRRQVAKYGDAIRFHGLIGAGVAFASAELAREVFAADPASFEVPKTLPSLLGPASLLATAGELHKRQRKLLNPRFHGARVKSYLETMRRVIREHCGVLRRAAEAKGVVAIRDLSQTMTLDVILETVFGVGTDAAERRRARDVLVGLMRSMSPSLVGATLLHRRWFPPWRKFVASRAAFDAWVDTLLAARRASSNLGSDVLGTLLESRFDDGSAMSDSEIRDQLMTLLLAGYETTATAVAWGVYWLLREPATLARLRRDIDALGPNPAIETLVRCPYLEAVVSESLRVEPVVTDVARLCKRDLKVGRWTVPAGDVAVVNLLAILTDARLFPEPERFRPERFLDRTFSAAEFLPFGGGTRRCLGAAFAEAELAIVLGTIASEWELALASDVPERAVRRNITMGPERGVVVKVLGPRSTV